MDRDLDCESNERCFLVFQVSSKHERDISMTIVMLSHKIDESRDLSYHVFCLRNMHASQLSFPFVFLQLSPQTQKSDETMDDFVTWRTIAIHKKYLPTQQ